MLIIGERINGMFKNVRNAIVEQDKDVIADLARRQVEAGAHVLDINVGPASDEPAIAMVWLIEAAQEAVDVPLAVDSAKLDVFEPALEACKIQPFINSTTGAQDKLDFFLPLARKYNASLIALTIDEQGVPSTTEGRTEIAMRILVSAMEQGVATDKLYIDPITLPVKAVQDQCPKIFEALGQFRQLADPSPHTVIGLSNVSQRAQEKHLLDRIFLAMCIAHGLDSAICDPLDKDLMDSMITAELLMDKQLYCDAFLEAYRR
jgi:5-methyltetrahydrofolate corrinoid/iron sulfur protein methyltransferase